MEDLDIRRFYAAMLVERGAAGDRKRACALLGEAIAGYRTIGMPRHQKLAEALAAKVGLQSDPGEAPDALTARESQVLRLVAKGHRTSEIAAELYLYAATVQRHVANIYAKLGVRNRAEARARRPNATATLPRDLPTRLGPRKIKCLPLSDGRLWQSAFASKQVPRYHLEPHDREAR